MAVQYNKDNNKWSGLIVDIYKAKKGIIDVSDEATKFFDKTKNWKNSSLVISDEKKFDSFIKKMDLADKSLIAFLKDTRYGTKDLTSYQQYLKDTGKSTSTFANFTKKTGSVLKSFGATVASMSVNMAIGMVISSIATFIDNNANRVKYAQERLDEFNSTVSESKNELETQKKWIEEHGKRYEELSRGVDNYGHAVSLTSDEISEYNSLTKDIESMFPSMISGYNDQNQAIVKMKGSVDELTESYKANVEAAYASTLAKSSEGFDDYKTATQDAMVSKNAIKSMISADKIRGHLLQNRNLSFETGEVRYDFSDVLGKDLYYQLVDEVKHGGYNVPGKVGNYDFSFSDLSVELQQKIRAALITANATIKTETAKVKPILEAFVYGNDGKDSGFGSLDEEGKQVIRNVISSLDDTFYEQFDSDSDMASYFYSNFIAPLKNGLDDTDLAVKINTLFSLNENDYESYQDYVNAVNDIINQIKNLEGQDGNPLYSEEQIDGLKNILGIGKVNNSGQLSGQSLIDTVKGKYSSIDGADEFIKTLSENELRVLYELKPDEAKSLDNLKQAVDSLNKETSDNKTTISTPLTFKEAWKSIGTTGDEKADKAALETKEKLEELAEAGKLTEEALEKSSIASVFTDAKISIKEATEEINKMKSSTDQLASMKTGISSISSILEEKKENQSSKETRTKGIGADTLAGMPEDVKAQTKEYEHFVEVLGDGTSKMKDCKDAASQLATAYVTSNNFLANLTPEMVDYYTSVLKQMGVENAAEVVKNALAKQTYALRLERLANSNATKEEIAALQEEAGQYGITSAELANYVLKKKINNNNALDTSKSINNLISLAKQCGATSKVITALQNLLQSTSELEGLYQMDLTDFTSIGTTDIQHAPDAASHEKSEAIGKASAKVSADRKKVLKLIKDATKIGASVDVKSTNPSGGKTDKSKSTQQIDWISRALDRLSSKLDLVKAKYDNLFDNKKAKDSDSLLKQQNKNLDKQYRILQKTEKYQEKAQKKYTAKANKVRISGNKEEDKSLKKAVENGRIKTKSKESKKKLIATYGEDTAKKIQEYQDWYDKARDAEKNRESAKTAMKENRIQQHQNKVDNAEEKRSLAQARKANATTAAAKKTQIDKEKDYLETSYDYQIEIARLEKDSLKVAQLKAEKKKALLDLDIEHHQNLADEYQTNLDSLSAQKENLTTAAQKNSVIDSEKAATQALYGEKIKIAQLEGNTAEASQLQAELTKAILDLDIEHHQNLADEYQMTLDRYSAAKALATTAADMNSYIDAEKQTTEALYDQKIAIANLEGKTNEAFQLEYEKQKALRDLEVERHQNLADEYQANLDMMSAQKENLTTASEKNALIDSEKATTQALYDEKIAIAQIEGNSAELLQLQYEKQKALRDLEIEQHQNLADEYQSSLDSLSAQKENLKTASEKNSVVDSEKALTLQLYNEKIAIAQLEGNISEELKLQAELDKQLVDFEKEKLDNIAQYYTNLRKINENISKNLGNSLDQLEARGLIATRGMYEAQGALNDARKRSLEEELILLEKQLDSIDKESPAYYDSLDSIQACKDEIAGCVMTAIELGEAIRNIDWKVFDKISSRFDLLSSEYDLGIELMSDKPLIDKNTGNFTTEGSATLGAFYSQLLLAQEKTNEFKNTLDTMKDHIDNGDEGYTDPKALDEYYENYEKYIELVKSEHGIQQKLIDIMKQKYQADLDCLQDIINKRKELLQAEKDAYDYQRSIEEKTKNVTVIAKQITALNGDDSEETKTRIQQLQVSLDEANKDLQDAEYQQWLSDQQTMLDNLYNEYSDFMDDKLNDTDALIQEAVTYLSDIDVGKSVSECLNDYYTEHGYDPTGDFKNITDELGEGGSIVKAIGNAVDSITQNSESQQRYHAEADAVSAEVSEIGDIFEDPKALSRLEAANYKYHKLGTAGDNGENIQKYMDESSVSTLNTKKKEAKIVYESADAFRDEVKALGDFDDRSSYTPENGEKLQKLITMYENLPTSAKALVADYKEVLDGKQSKYEEHGQAVQAEGEAFIIEERKKEQEKPIKRESIRKWLADQKSNSAIWMNVDPLDYDKQNELTAIQRYIHDKIETSDDVYYLNEIGLKKLDSYLNTLEIPGGDLYKRLESLGFSQGGIVESLQKVPGMNGDDGWATLKKGEAVLTPEQTEQFIKLTQNIDMLNPSIDFVKNLSKRNFDIVPNQTISQSVGDIHIELPNASDFDSFVKEFQKNPKIEKIIHSMIYDKNSFSKYKW